MSEKINTSNPIVVGLLWHSLASGNLGVGALTESHLAIVASIARRQGRSVRFLVLGVTDEGQSAVGGEFELEGDSIECRRVRLFRRTFQRDVAECDIVLDIGAGDSFADIYGFKRFFYYWLSKNITALSGTPLVLSPQTIGPFDGFVARQMARQAMSRCDRIFPRDNLSTRYLNEMGASKNAEEAVDVAFKLPFTRQSPREDGKLHIGLNVSGLLFNGGYTGGNQFGLTVDYPQVVREIIRRIAAIDRCVIHLVSHVIEPKMPVEDDVAVANQLATEFDNVVVAPAFSRPSEAKSYISGLDFFAGARMHACIAAFSSGVPVVPMAYSRKFNGLFESLKYQYVADMKKSSDREVVEAVVSGLASRDTLRGAVAEGNSIAAEKIGIYERYLEALFARIKA